MWGFSVRGWWDFYDSIALKGDEVSKEVRPFDPVLISPKLPFHGDGIVFIFTLLPCDAKQAL